LDHTIIWSHRGGTFTNSIPSYKRAFSLGADGIKTEAHLSKDGTVIFRSFPKIDVDGVLIDLSDIDIDEIKKRKQTIPTLEDLYLEFKDTQLLFNFDIWNKDTGVKIIEYAQDHDFINRVELTKPASIDVPIEQFFKPLKNQDSEIKCVNSICGKYAKIKESVLELDNMHDLNIEVFNIQHFKLEEKIFNIIKESGFKIYLWGVIFKYYMRKYLSMDQIDGIFSSRLENLIYLRNQIQIMV
jgi:glycerophosphoryl diester phosphodiesterase